LPWFVKENRRVAPRHRYDDNNTWIRLEGSLTRPCQVLDLSRTGVRLRVKNADRLPNTFTLILSKNGSGRSARVKWRRGTEIGAEFFRAQPSSASHSTAAAPNANSSSASGANSASVSAHSANSSPASGANSSSASGANSSSASRSTADVPRSVKPRGGEKQKSESLMSANSLHAQAQQPHFSKLKADTRAVVGSISADKAKTETHRQITGPSERLDRADQKKQSKKRMDLSRLQKKLGPDHVALIHMLKNVDPESPHGRELTTIIDSLDKSRD